MARPISLDELLQIVTDAGLHHQKAFCETFLSNMLVSGGDPLVNVSTAYQVAAALGVPEERIHEIMAIRCPEPAVQLGAGFWELMGGALLGAPIYSHARTVRARNFFYIFTAAADSTGQKGFSLVRLDRRDGKEIGRLWFSKRNPRYRIDGASGVVYQFEGEDLVLARRFPRTAADSELAVTADSTAP